MNDVTETLDDRRYQARVMDAAVRIALLALLMLWCFNIVKPFIMPVLWGAIISVAIYPLFLRTSTALGERRKLAATLITLLALAVLIVPSILLGASLVDGAQSFSEQLEAGKLTIPPPSEQVKSWPLIGEKAYSTWMLFSQNLEAALQEFLPQVEAVISWIIGATAGVGMGVLLFLVSILIAGAFLVYGERAGRALETVATRILKGDGKQFVDLASATIRSVAQGVLGVAVIQAILAGIGLMLVGVPYAGLWALLVLLLAIIQLPPILILGPIIVYVFSVESTVPAVLFMIWSLIVSGSDAFLKPLFLGRGMDIPMLVILLGAIGGMMLSGIIGLFVGAVVLAVGYTLFMAWLERGEAA